MNIKRAWYVIAGIALVLSLPIEYEVARDVYIRAQIVTYSLRHQEVYYGVESFRQYDDEHDFQGIGCAVGFGEGNIASRSYAFPCNNNPFHIVGGSRAPAEVASGFFDDEVITLQGVQLWRGQPAGDVSFALTLWYSLCFSSLLYAVSLGILRHSRTPDRRKDWELGMALAPVLIGGLVGWMAEMVMLIVHGDLLIGMAVGLCAAIGVCLRINFNWRQQQ